MKTLLLILLLPAWASAQWQRKAGVNPVPLIARSAEITTEFSYVKWYSLTADVGYTFNTGHVGMIHHAIWD